MEEVDKNLIAELVNRLLPHLLLVVIFIISPYLGSYTNPYGCP